LAGPDSRVAEVVAVYNESRVLFTPIGYDVAEVVLDTRGSWSLVLSNGTRIVVGNQQARPRLERFAHLLPQLLQYRTERLQRADLRYTNGFALVWGEAEDSPSRIPDPQTT
jgi:cell division protein FtsQ